MNLVGERVRQTSETDQNVPSPARAEPPVSESRQPPAPAASRPASEHTQGAGRELGGHWEDIGRLFRLGPTVPLSVSGLVQSSPV